MSTITKREAFTQRTALGRVRTELYSRIQRYRREREQAEALIANLHVLERTATEEAEAIDAMLELTNPHKRT